jgi:hypothetical protein
VRIDPLLCRPVGKSGGAFLDGSPQHIYHDIDQGLVLAAAAKRIGSSALFDLTGTPPRTARRLARGGRPRLSTVQRAISNLSDGQGEVALLQLLGGGAHGGTCAWPGCRAAIDGRAVWCRSHGRRSGADRARARGREETEPRSCVAPGCDHPARRRSAACSEACKRRVLRLRAARPPEKQPRPEPAEPDWGEFAGRGRRLAAQVAEGQIGEEEWVF